MKPTENLTLEQKSEALILRSDKEAWKGFVRREVGFLFGMMTGPLVIYLQVISARLGWQGAYPLGLVCSFLFLGWAVLSMLDGLRILLERVFYRIEFRFGQGHVEVVERRMFSTKKFRLKPEMRIIVSKPHHAVMSAPCFRVLERKTWSFGNCLSLSQLMVVADALTRHLGVPVGPITGLRPGQRR